MFSENMEAIVLHRGFGNKDKVIVSGHVFERYPSLKVNKRQSVLSTIISNLRRYINSPAKHVLVKIDLNEEQHVVTTDEHGFFKAEISAQHTREGWFSYRATVPSKGLEEQAQYRICNASSTGVISDIDDTLLVSHSSIDWRKLYTYLSKNTAKRKPTAAVNNIINGLSKFNNGEGTTDYFYVSNSEWNLYEFLMAFFDLHEIPKGVYLLNSIIHHPLDFLQRQGKSEVEGHKMKAIRSIFNEFPAKKFVLIGDTGQHDIQVFQHLIDQVNPPVKAIFLREIKEKHNRKYQALAQLCDSKNIQFEVFDE